MRDTIIRGVKQGRTQDAEHIPSEGKIVHKSAFYTHPWPYCHNSIEILQLSPKRCRDLEQTKRSV